MKKEDVKKIVKYWQATAEHDYKTMTCLFKGKRYSDSLFFGHIILEKILKGLVVKRTGKEAPYIHNLIKLLEIAKCDLLEEEKDLLDEINDFNIRARYLEYKMQFYKQCNKKYTEEYLNKITKLYKKLCQKLMQKK